MNMIKYATIIVTYNRREKLIKAIQSHLNQKIQPQKIIIVDNASDDDTGSLFNHNGMFANNSIINYHRLPTNIGGSGGFQVALEKATSLPIDWVLFGDDDAYFEPDYVEKLTQNLNNLALSDNMAVLTGVIKKYHTDDIELGSRSILRNAKYIFLSQLSNEDYNKNTYIDVFTFVGPLIKKSAIKKVGSIHSDYFIHFDDSEFALRLREKNYKAINIADALVFHDSSGATQLPERDWRLYYDVRNRIHMMILHGEANTFFKIIVSCLLVSRTGKQVLLRKKPTDYVYNMSALIHGFKDALSKRLGKNEKFLP